MKRIIPLLALLAASAVCAASEIHQIEGRFEIKFSPQPVAEGSNWARQNIFKTYEGGLVGSSRGEMLSARGKVKGSAGYVALEEVSATLDGRQGTFVIQHSGSMSNGAATLTVTVVPDSGTGGLTGLSGIMTIDAQRRYTFSYKLPAH